MVAALLLTHPEVRAGAVLIATAPPFEAPPPADLTGRRVLISNAEDDPMAPGERTLALAAQLREQGADVELRTHSGGHEVLDGHVPGMQTLCVRPAAPSNFDLHVLAGFCSCVFTHVCD